MLDALQQLLTLEAVHGESQFTSLAGLRLHHFAAGEGRPIVLLHGASGGFGNWYRLLNGLSMDRRVIALDLPGFGLSEGIEPTLPLGAMVADLVQRWLAAIGLDRFDLVATSFGSLIALRLAQRAPQCVGRVALINSVGLGRDVPWQLRVASLSAISSVALRPSRAGASWQFHRLMTSDRSRLPEPHISALLEYIWQSAAAGRPKQLTRAFSLFSSLRGQREVLSEEELRSFPVPLLIAWGAQDRFLPLHHAQRAAALVPAARLSIIPRAGHSPNWEAPEAVLECLSSFLRPALAP